MELKNIMTGQIFTPELVLYSTVLRTQRSGPNSPSQKNYKILIVIK